jgi:deazaflavin-dependent oxidoreductase (nitroreductase family)
MAEPSQTLQSLYPSTPMGRFIWRAPMVTYRLGLGPIVGRVLMILSTTGRKSGLPRRAMIEYHCLKGKKYIAAGFGPEAQWYKNIQSDPRVTVQSADGAESMRAVRVTEDDELLAVVNLFRRTDSAMAINWFLGTLGIEPSDEDILAKKDCLHLLRLEPTGEHTPPPMEADLVWLWPVAAVILAIGILISLRLQRD